MTALRLITVTACPSCGAGIVGESWDERSADGRHEVRRFACGFSLFHIFGKGGQSEDPCPKSQEYVEKQRKRQAAVAEVDRVIAALDVDENYRTCLRENPLRIMRLSGGR